jgi:hypothetical protein
MAAIVRPYDKRTARLAEIEENVRQVAHQRGKSEEN